MSKLLDTFTELRRDEESLLFLFMSSPLLLERSWNSRANCLPAIDPQYFIKLIKLMVEYIVKNAPLLHLTRSLTHSFYSRITPLLFHSLFLSLCLILSSFVVPIFFLSSD